ncbi:vitamin K epoxide reductase family protein [Candidatus Microgenomates bacterium]|nr:vitamin K epoxide reductase family protein [Candidatus Microgenomates bacterium]
MHRNVVLNRIIFFLSLIGIVLAVYVLQSFLRQTSIVCLNSGCELVRKSPASYLFGLLPVPAVGLVGYSLLAILSFLRSASTKYSVLFLKIMLGIAIFGVLFVSWFTYTEIFIIKAICTWCAVSAVNMFVIFLLVGKSYLLESKVKKGR